MDYLVELTTLGSVALLSGALFALRSIGALTRRNAVVVLEWEAIVETVRPYLQKARSLIKR